MSKQKEQQNAFEALEELTKNLKFQEEAMVKLSAPLIFETEIGTFHYDYNEISVEQAGQAETMWRFYERSMKLLPRTPDDIQAAVTKQFLNKFMGFLLTEIDADGLPKLFPDNPVSHAGLKATKYIKGDALEQMDIARQNFFTRRGLPTLESEDASNSSLEYVTKLREEGRLDEMLGAITDIAQVGQQVRNGNPETSSTEISTDTAQNGKQPKDQILEELSGS